MSLRFFREYLKNPGMVGSVLPSSCHLARAMAAAVGHADALVELGAGTGAITRELVAAHKGAPLVAFERDSHMAARLQRRFPDVAVINQYVHEGQEVLSGLPANATLVSGLPFRSFSRELRRKTLRIITETLLASPRRSLVQFTYHPRAPFKAPSKRLVWRRYGVVWRNLPPASVWVLEHKEAVPA